jgi:hypothetical protein
MFGPDTGYHIPVPTGKTVSGWIERLFSYMASGALPIVEDKFLEIIYITHVSTLSSILKPERTRSTSESCDGTN